MLLLLKHWGKTYYTERQLDSQNNYRRNVEKCATIRKKIIRKWLPCKPQLISAGDDGKILAWDE